jgi:ferric-dicitrate binding protein FerR (iron transport regulator)
MNAPRYARLSARLLAQESSVEPPPSSERRAETLAVISRALRAKTRRRALRARAAGLAAVALALLLGYVSVRKPPRATRATESHVVSAVLELPGNGAEIVGPAGTRTPLGSLGLRPGGRLLAGSGGGATVQLSTGTRMAIEHDTSLQFENAGPDQRFFLAHGELHAKVAKLAAGERFVVRTPDAEVEVRGTVFRVTIVAPAADCGSGTVTRVSVDEGLVEVREAGASSLVRPGESWPAHCGAALPVATPPAQVEHVVAHGVAPKPRAPASVAAKDSGQEHASSIAQQNELFSEAIVARRLGDNAAAVGSFELFVARYPESPLAESAAVHRLGLLRRLDPVAARSAARSYLARYPSGYARHDAEQLISQP